MFYLHIFQDYIHWEKKKWTNSTRRTQVIYKNNSVITFYFRNTIFLEYPHFGGTCPPPWWPSWSRTGRISTTWRCSASPLHNTSTVSSSPPARDTNPVLTPPTTLPEAAQWNMGQYRSILSTLSTIYMINV